MVKIPNLFKNLALLFVAIFIVIILCEIGTRIFWASPKFKYPQTLHDTHEVLGWVMKPNQKAYTWHIPVSINSLGLRDTEIPVKKPVNKIRLLNIGDSVTFGVLVGNDETYANQLEGMLNQADSTHSYDVINAGVQRYFLYQEVDYLRLNGLELEPDIVVAGLYINDLGFRPATWEREYEKGREKIATVLWNHIPFIMNNIKNSAFVGLLRNRYFKLKHATRGKNSISYKILNGIKDAQMKKLWNAAEGYIDELKTICESRNIKLLLVFFPGANQVVSDYPAASYPLEFVKMAEKKGIDFIDLLPVFKQHYNGDIRSLYFRYNGHPNAYGHHLAAEAIFNKLATNNFLSSIKLQD